MYKATLNDECCYLTRHINYSSYSISTEIWQAMNSYEVETTIGIHFWFEISE
jgi:hypothetical protein